MNRIEITRQPEYLYAANFQAEKVCISGTGLGMDWDHALDSEVTGGHTQAFRFTHDPATGLCTCTADTETEYEWLRVLLRHPHLVVYVQWGCWFGLRKGRVCSVFMGMKFIRDELRLDMSRLERLPHGIQWVLKTPDSATGWNLAGNPVLGYVPDVQSSATQGQNLAGLYWEMEEP